MNTFQAICRYCLLTFVFNNFLYFERSMPSHSHGEEDDEHCI
jgi:hypothetical protein